ncbi:MAG: hypothetical protein PHU62_05220 [Bacteroidales bacterium]|nr:hypothetical protein [Bacteroidales bacterium]MDD2204528.1 hypothetical protein [Bacteroidales bacterium]MDD3152614.1 hypothetical protein [Bacteroidales bacterium]MDD3913468.1 hypothetical protein [Bacteroidales bacterium]MDD4633958.1 hypothetical protein [Bacteroidales bacterium]
MKHKINYDNISDLELIDRVINNEPPFIDYFFYQKCDKLFSYIVSEIFHNNIEKQEVANEFYLHLQANEWAALKSFQGKSKLITWLTVVATHFFIKERNTLIYFQNSVPLYEKEIDKKDDDADSDDTELYRGYTKIDLYNAIRYMPNLRYRLIIISELEEEKFEITAKKLDTTIDNLYNLRHLARLQLKTTLKKLKDGKY